MWKDDDYISMRCSFQGLLLHLYYLFQFQIRENFYDSEHSETFYVQSNGDVSDAIGAGDAANDSVDRFDNAGEGDNESSSGGW